MCIYHLAVCGWLPAGVSSHGKKGKSGKKPRRRAGKKRGEEGEEGEEAGEETDEGDMEGEEVDYMSRSSSESEEEFQVTHTHTLLSCFSVVWVGGSICIILKPWLYDFSHTHGIVFHPCHRTTQ